MIINKNLEEVKTAIIQRRERARQDLERVQGAKETKTDWNLRRQRASAAIVAYDDALREIDGLEKFNALSPEERAQLCKTLNFPSPDFELTVALPNGQTDTAILSHIAEKHDVVFYYRNADLTEAVLRGLQGAVGAVILDLRDLNVKISEKTSESA